MPYCSIAIKLKDECDWSIDDALAEIGKELFKAETVHGLHGDSHNIDAVENNVRAIVTPEERHICLFCRYEKDAAKIEDKIARFVTAHSNQYELIEVDRKGNPASA